MELIYIYLGNINGIVYDLGINLSQDKIVNFDKNTLKIDIQERTRSTPEKFFSDNIVNITCIVGSNGVGKSTILDVLGEMNLNKKSKGWEYFLIYAGEDYLIEFENIPFEYNNEKFDHNYLYKLQLNNLNIVESFIKVSFNSNLKYYKLDQGNRSSLVDRTIKFKRKYTQVSPYNLYKLIKHDKFIEHFFNYKKLVNLKVSFAGEYNYLHMNDYEHGKAHKLEDFFLIEESLINNAKLHLRTMTMRAIILQYYIHINKHENRLVVKSFERYLDFMFKRINLFDLDTIIKFSIEKVCKDSDMFCKKIGITFEILNSLPNEMFKYSSIRNITGRVYKIPYIDLNDAAFKSDIEKILDYIEEYNEFELFKLDYGNYSTGEEALLLKLSQIRSIGKKNKSDDQIETKILLIDEFDQNIHPEWQRKYLNYLVEYFKTLGNDTNYQIIFTTHSPFVVSDLPRESIIKLSVDNESDKRTASFANKSFASNFYEIMNDGFFLKDAVGEFAKNKINKLIDKINESTTNSEQSSKIALEKDINLIDDEFIRGYLESKLIEQLGHRSKIELTKNQIKNLEDKLKILENENGQLN